MELLLRSLFSVHETCQVGEKGVVQADFGDGVLRVILRKLNRS